MITTSPLLLGAEFFCPHKFPQTGRKVCTHERQIDALRQQFLGELEAAQNSESVEKLRVAYLGKKGSVTELLKGLKSVAGDQKKEMGQLINQLKRQVEEGISQQMGENPRRRGRAAHCLC